MFYFQILTIATPRAKLVLEKVICLNAKCQVHHRKAGSECAGQKRPELSENSGHNLQSDFKFIYFRSTSISSTL